MNKLLSVVKRVPIVLIYQLSKLSPRSKKIIVFGGENGKAFRGNTKYLYKAFVRNSNFKCVWITKNKKTLRTMREMEHTVYSSWSLKGIYYQLRAATVVHSHSIHDDFTKVFLGGVLSINTWHGVGLKKVWAARSQTFTYRAIHEKNKVKRYFMMLVEKTNRGKENYVFSTSETVSKFFPETFLLSQSQLPILGQVRNDVFYQKSIDDESVDKRIKYSKTVTYMPTHRNHGLDDPDINNVIDFVKLDQICEENDILFILKRHMFSKGKIPGNLKNILDVSSDEIEPQILLKYTDVLITDYSSCYTDFLLLNRPIIFFPFDLDKYLMHSNEMYFNYDDTTPGPKVTTFSQLVKEIENYCLHNVDEFKEDRIRVRDIFYSKEVQKPVLKRQVDFIQEKILS
ncbi:MULTISPECIES: CDP-glycerol glycerophosphotransferase family protein [Bacillaceae]|uniref:Teichoic acid poly(glycerol phosphate) polymerase n=1 Tax=Alkalicoccobacillus plakortidis TaxID=444060 RepID=A0A9D5DS55_9BACI|nr:MULTISPECIES: CDP-glycerol glycerophosphotransferase family protein [Bacillaceae]KQL57046.1 hypothetical protein AN965_10230 [Alkalicoccobacillus plakortidis]